MPLCCCKKAGKRGEMGDRSLMGKQGMAMVNSGSGPPPSESAAEPGKSALKTEQTKTDVSQGDPNRQPVPSPTAPDAKPAPLVSKSSQAPGEETSKTGKTPNSSVPPSKSNQSKSGQSGPNESAPNDSGPKDSGVKESEEAKESDQKDIPADQANPVPT